jgi:ribosomal protein S18 acetylase RimI-like enzyme
MSLIKDGNGKDVGLFRNANIDDIDTMISIVANDCAILEISPHPIDKQKEPWTWLADKKLTFRVVCDIDGKINGFYIARHIKNNTHLHSFYIDKGCRNNGLGSFLLFEHWNDAIRNNTGVQTLTLHVYEKNTSAIKFYSKYGYEKIMQKSDLVYQDDGFGSWASNCKKKGSWPLDKGVSLYGIHLKNLDLRRMRRGNYEK